MSMTGTDPRTGGTHRLWDGSTLKNELVRAMKRLEKRGVMYPEGHPERILAHYTLEKVPYPYIIRHVGEARIIRHFCYPRLVEQSGRLLDYGCGTGDALRQLLQNGYPRDRICGFDVNRKSIDLGMDLYADRDANADLFIVADTFPFPPCSFDLIYSGSVLHVIKDEEEFLEYLQNALYALRPGGSFFGSTLGLRDAVTERGAAGPPRLMKRHELTEYLVRAGFSRITLCEGSGMRMQDEDSGICIHEFRANRERR
jgi:SAM-dependent methyltransferase